MDIVIVIACADKIATAETQYSLPGLQGSAFGPYPEPDKLGPCH
jgi:hypothetical protein